ncbi:hypothetical protein BGZ73_005032 [Actinomortierella ambigua]|nr:hypothetical protein BGZ73_005032 [Actinomortierella ambigua]
MKASAMAILTILAVISSSVVALNMTEVQQDFSDCIAKCQKKKGGQSYNSCTNMCYKAWSDAIRVLGVLAGSPQEEYFCGEFHKACQTTARTKCVRPFQGYSMYSLCKANFDKKTKACKDYETSCDCTYGFINEKESHVSEVLELTFAATNNTCLAAKAINPTPTASGFSAAPTSGSHGSLASMTTLAFVAAMSLLVASSLF